MLRPVLWFFLALWVIVGGGVLVLALTGGPGGLRAHLHKESPVARRVRSFVFVLIAAGGLAVPIAVAVANGEHHAGVGPGGVRLTKNEQIGRELFARTCAGCHTLAGAAAVGHVGPNLDVLVPNEAIVLYAIQHGYARGNGQMPANIYTGRDARDVAQFVAAVAGRS